MRQPIKGYYRDDDQHWVSVLACGHNEHVRHSLPWMDRTWVTFGPGVHRCSASGWDAGSHRALIAAKRERRRPSYSASAFVIQGLPAARTGQSEDTTIDVPVAHAHASATSYRRFRHDVWMSV